MRAVLDPNVFISAMLSSKGAPARLIEEWRRGGFELIVSPALTSELERALAYPKLSSRIEPALAAEFVSWLAGSATVAADPLVDPMVTQSRDSGDDYLLALAEHTNSALVSGDKHLLDLRKEGLPIYAPAEFLGLISGE